MDEKVSESQDMIWEELFKGFLRTLSIDHAYVGKKEPARNLVIFTFWD